MTIVLKIVMLLQAAAASGPAIPVRDPDLLQQRPTLIETPSLLDAAPNKPISPTEASSPESPPFKTIHRFVVRRVVGSSGDVFIVEVQEASLPPAVQSVLIVEQLEADEERAAKAPKQ